MTSGANVFRGSPTAVQMFVLASRVSMPDDSPRLIDSDNKSPSVFPSLLEAWRSGEAFAVQPAPGFVVVDVDDVHLGDLAETRRSVRALGYPYLEVASGGSRSPRRHFWIRCSDAADAVAVATSLPGLVNADVRLGKGQRVRPPGAPHRSGSGIAEPVDGDEAQRWVEGFTPNPAQLLARLPSGLAEQVRVGVRHDRSRSDFMTTRRLIVAGFDNVDILTLAFCSRSAYCKRFGTQHGRRFEDVLRMISKITRTPSAGMMTRDHTKAYLCEVRRAIDLASSEECGGAFRKRVLLGTIDMFHEFGTVERHISIRDLAISAQVSTKTANSHLKELIAGDWLRRIAWASGSKAACYSVETRKVRDLLREMSGSYHIGTHKGGVNTHVVDPGLSGSQSFRHGYLNESGRDTLKALHTVGGSGTTAEIIKLSGRARSTTHHALRRLMKEGLVRQPHRGTWELVDVDDWDLIDEQTGADIVAKRQQATIEAERAIRGRYRLARYGHSDLLKQYEPTDGTWALDIETGEKTKIDDLIATDVTTGGPTTGSTNRPKG